MPSWAEQPVVLTSAAQANYMLNCMGCHLPDGSGAAGKVPSVRESLVTLSSSAAGRRFLVQVPGASQSPLTDLELAQVLNWMVRNLSAPPVPADSLARDRRVTPVAHHAPTGEVSERRRDRSDAGVAHDPAERDSLHERR